MDAFSTSRDGGGVQLYNILDATDLAALRHRANLVSFRKIPVGLNQSIMLAAMPNDISITLRNAAEFGVHHPLQLLSSMLRLNTTVCDAEPRIHTDNDIGGVRPVYGSVSYLEDGPPGLHGTALYEHPEYGRGSDDVSVFTDNTGWEPWYINQAKANSMFLFKSNLYHGRYPWTTYGVSQLTGRKVVVQFYR